MRRFIFAAPFLLCTLATSAQEPKPVPEPEYVNTFFVLSADGQLKPLHRQAAQIKTKSRAFGLGSTSSLYAFPGERSSVRLEAGVPLEFVVRPEAVAFGGGSRSDVDPATYIQLFSLKKGKGQRELEIARVGIMGDAKSTPDTSVVEIEISKYGTNSIRIVPSKPLPPGEYMLAANASMTVPQAFCFGVEPLK